MKIAQFQYSPGTACIFTEDSARYITDAVRSSEWVEVDFPPRAGVEIAEDRAKLIDRRRALLQRKLAAIDDDTPF
jgi:hypothetical protein